VSCNSTCQDVTHTHTASFLAFFQSAPSCLSVCVPLCILLSVLHKQWACRVSDKKQLQNHVLLRAIVLSWLLQA